MEKNKAFIKTVFIFVLYLTYNILISNFFNLLGITNNTLIEFIADVLFLIVILFFYNKSILVSIKEFNIKSKIKNKILSIMKFVVLIILINILYGKVIDIFFNNINTKDANTLALYAFADISFIYTIFKTLIFAPVAEELLFKKSIRDIIDNNILFFIVSGCLYAFMNIIYTDLSFVSIITFIRCFILSSILSYVYIKNDDNIFYVMLVKFFYNLIPLALLMLGV